MLSSQGKTLFRRSESRVGLYSSVKKYHGLRSTVITATSLSDGKTENFDHALAQSKLSKRLTFLTGNLPGLIMSTREILTV